MKETPAPFRVVAITSFGPFCARSPSSVSASERTSCPSQRPSAQPKASTFASRSPRSLTSDTHVSDWTSLRSTMTVISSKRRLAVGCSDSQICPSCSSPSPVRT